MQTGSTSRDKVAQDSTRGQAFHAVKGYLNVSPFVLDLPYHNDRIKFRAVTFQL